MDLTRGFTRWGSRIPGMVDPRDDPIRLVPSRYDEWCDRFEAERVRIRDALRAQDLWDRCRRIEHVGSTAVADLAAKDVVDLDVVVDDGAVQPVADALVDALGGTRFENDETWHPIHREHDGQRFNVHVFAASSDRWKRSFVTCEVLRADPDLREEYEELKRELAAEHDDLVAYSEEKDDFVARLLRIAREDDELTVDVDVPGPD